MYYTENWKKELFESRATGEARKIYNELRHVSSLLGKDYDPQTKTLSFMPYIR